MDYKSLNKIENHKFVLIKKLEGFAKNTIFT